ncbi:hypothetical protein HK100_007848 [Physocladia obscura]|uniref:Uncharacterized protein n=1 Tax=Physocladia obscura TaxID=109957 RepID=A0AAD5XBV7_9FUNG|nr:hypothetical protein HK100_007848 [Physocladia obscura]
MGYQKKQVVVNVLDAEGVVVGTCEAVTFVTPFSIVSEDYWPSKRYLDLCVDGAKQHDVPEDYVKWLASHRCYDPAKTTFGKRVGKFAMLGIACFNVIPVIPVGFLFIRNGWQPPWIVTWWIQGSFTMLRFVHTYGLKHLFGSGINHLDLEKESCY